MHYLLSHIQTINKSLIYFCIDWEVSSIMEKFCYVFTMFKEKDTYALMCHPVGRHNDKFKNGITSKLENCFCMFLNLDQHNKTNVKGIDACENNYAYGRGRNWIHSYSIAVLDWYVEKGFNFSMLIITLYLLSTPKPFSASNAEKGFLFSFNTTVGLGVGNSSQSQRLTIWLSSGSYSRSQLTFRNHNSECLIVFHITFEFIWYPFPNHDKKSNKS